jgi:CheY-like chemotaxis protein
MTLSAPSLTKTKLYYIVDDDPDDQQFLIDALTKNDLSVTCITATNGQEAILCLSNSANPVPDAIFLDLNMPRMNGKECLTELKLTPSLRHIPVIIYSTTSDKREIKETMQLGAIYFLVKKSIFSELRKELSSIAM